MSLENKSQISQKEEFNISKHEQLRQLETIGLRAIVGYSKSVLEKLSVDEAKKFLHTGQEITGKNPRMLSVAHLNFTSWLLENEIQPLVQDDELLKNFVERIKDRIKEIKKGQPAITPDNDKEGGITYDLLTASKEAKEAKNEERQEKLSMIYNTWRASTDMLTHEWAEWALDKLLNLTENEKREALLERLKEKLTASVHEAPLKKE